MKVSLCITSYYKDIIYFERLIPYLANQTQLPDEIILFCSGIEDLKIPNINDLPIKIYKQNRLANPAQARNFCASKSSNELLIFFDIDDYPHPQKTEMTLKYIDGYDFLIHSYNINNKNFDIITKPLTTHTNLFANPTCTNIYCENKPIHHAHIAVKKNIFNTIRYNTNKIYYKKEDGKFCQDLLENNYRGIYLDHPLVSYTI